MFDTTGEAASNEYDYIGCFSNGLVYIADGDSKKVVDEENNNIFDKDIDDVILGHMGRCSVCERMFVKFKGDTKYSMIDSKEHSAIDFTCDNADLFLEDAAAFESDGKWGFVSDSGEVLIKPEYEEAKSFSNGYAAVKVDGKWGYINEKQEMVVEPEFDDALYFNTVGESYVFTDGEGWKKISLLYAE